MKAFKFSSIVEVFFTISAERLVTLAGSGLISMSMTKMRFRLARYCTSAMCPMGTMLSSYMSTVTEYILLLAVQPVNEMPNNITIKARNAPARRVPILRLLSMVTFMK